MPKITFQTPIKYLPGVGQKRSEQLEKLGISDVGSLLYHLPRAYQHRGDLRLIREALDGETASFMLTIAKTPENARVKNGRIITKIRAFDESGSCTIVYFNQPYMKDNIKIGATYRFWGKTQVNGRLVSISSPDCEPWYEGLELPEFYPIYPLTSGITNKYLNKVIATALESVEISDEEDVIPEKIRERADVEGVKQALFDIHRPQNYALMDKARRRFVFEQLYIFALGISMQRQGNNSRKAPIIKNYDMKAFTSVLPFELTDAQKQVINDVARDIRKPVPMKRMITGDVGCGKTVCAAACAFMAMEEGYQAAIMAPTSILATQHYNDLSELFARLGYECELLVGSTTQKEKKRIYALLASGELKLVIGTHALLSEGVEFADPGVFITDEQHRFGVMQRAELSRKGAEGQDMACHTLVMTATPIPRSLALAIYGDLALSRIEAMPKGRQKVDTFAVNESYRTRINKFIKKQVANKNQVYIVCPSIQEAEKDEDEATLGNIVGFDYKPGEEAPKLKSAVEYAENLQNKVFPELKVSLMHGKMKPAEKDEIMSDFAKGKIDILVSTTVIEVGVNVPNATLMIVENAERFGLAQLHQLRGRVGRGSAKSYCILVSDSKSSSAQERLKTMCETADGFKIAEADLNLRGPGDYFATDTAARQHGIGVNLAGICNDMSDLNFAFETARMTLEEDENLLLPEHRALRERVYTLTGKVSYTIS